MEYQPLKKIYHRDASPSRDANHKQQYAARLESPGTFRMGVATPTGELFLACPRELTVLHSNILERERACSTLLAALPPIAQDRILRSFIADDILSTNEIEDVHSTRRQVSEAVSAAAKAMADTAASAAASAASGTAKRSGKTEAVRFREFALLYQQILEGNKPPVHSAADVRALYDQVTYGEIKEGDLPDGEFFRKEGVDIVGSGSRVLHRGLHPEAAIIDAVERMISIANDADIPPLYRAISAHYVFEYAHPFYDGNGRTGRFLLTSWLCDALTLPTVFSLSKTLLGHRSEYYRAFQTVEDPLNHAELTFFVYAMLELVEQAQDDAMDRLEKAAEDYTTIEAIVGRLAREKRLQGKEPTIVQLLLQYEAFGLYGTASLDEIAAVLEVKPQMARKYMRNLEERGVCERRGKYNPVVFGLTEAFVKETGL